MTEIKSYGKSELALLYFPNAATSAGALSNLKSWIKGNSQLCEALDKCGMDPKLKSYTPKEVAFMFEYLGEPNESTK